MVGRCRRIAWSHAGPAFASAAMVLAFARMGDLDMFNLHEGVEFLHRVMWDHGVPHEYRLVRGADHLGKTMQPRMRDALKFLDRAVLRPPPPDTSFETQKAAITRMRRTMGVPDGEPQPPFPPTSPAK